MKFDYFPAFSDLAGKLTEHPARLFASRVLLSCADVRKSLVVAAQKHDESWFHAKELT